MRQHDLQRRAVLGHHADLAPIDRCRQPVGPQRDDRPPELKQRIDRHLRKHRCLRLGGDPVRRLLKLLESPEWARIMKVPQSGAHLAGVELQTH